MAHKTVIICDGCSAEGRAEGSPYPEGWVIASITWWIGADKQTPRARVNKDRDLCPDCAKAVRISMKIA